MKNLLFLSATIIALSATLGSCTQKDFKTEIAAVDSLQTVLSKTEQSFKKINPEEVSTMRDKITADLDSAAVFVEKNKLSITPDDGMFFGRYQALTTSVQSFTALHNKLKNEIERTHKQLSDLEADLKNKAIAPEKAREYIKQEKNAVLTISEAVGNLVTVVDNLKENAGPSAENFAERMQKIVNTKSSPGKKS